MGRENRRHLQRDIELVVHVIVTSGAAIPCWLSDVSEGGARLATAVTLPNRFLLKFSNTLSRWCQVMWRSDQAVGVQFTADASAHRAPVMENATEIMRPVMITCRQTSKLVPTVVQVRANSDLRDLPTARNSARCPHCSGVHGWERSRSVGCRTAVNRSGRDHGQSTRLAASPRRTSVGCRRWHGLR